MCVREPREPAGSRGNFGRCCCSFFIIFVRSLCSIGLSPPLCSCCCYCCSLCLASLVSLLCAVHGADVALLLSFSLSLPLPLFVPLYLRLICSLFLSRKLSLYSNLSRRFPSGFHTYSIVYSFSICFFLFSPHLAFPSS